MPIDRKLSLQIRALCESIFEPGTRKLRQIQFPVVFTKAIATTSSLSRKHSIAESQSCQRDASENILHLFAAVDIGTYTGNGSGTVPARFGRAHCPGSSFEHCSGRRTATPVSQTGLADTHWPGVPACRKRHPKLHVDMYG